MLKENPPHIRLGDNEKTTLHSGPAVMLAAIIKEHGPITVSRQAVLNLVNQDRVIWNYSPEEQLYRSCLIQGELTS